MPEGKYICKIHNWNFRNSGGKGKAEIEFEDIVYQYEYPATKNKEWVTIAEVTLKDGKFSIEHKLPRGSSSREIWSVQTNQYQKINMMMFSPNHWDGQENGNKHYFFTLDKCQNPEKVRGFYNEFLMPELLPHRKTFEVLSSKMMCKNDEAQLSGLGFSSTQRNTMLVRTKGTLTRAYKIQF